MRTDKNGFAEVPESIDWRASFEHDRHTDDGCPIIIDTDVEEVVREAEKAMEELKDNVPVCPKCGDKLTGRCFCDYSYG